MRWLLSLWLLVLFGGCASGPPKVETQAFAGHWTLGAAFSVFTTLDGRNYQVDMPLDAYNVLSSQPPNPRSSPETGETWSAYVEGIGRLIPLAPQGGSGDRLRIVEITRMGPARPEFLATLPR